MNSCDIKMQILGGIYSFECDTPVKYYGFLDCSEYTLSLVVGDYSSIEYNRPDFKLFMKFLESSDFKNDILCKQVLSNIVRQCLWVDFDFCKKIRRKLFSDSITSTRKADDLINSEVSEFLSTLDKPIPEFTFNCLMKVCEVARENGILSDYKKVVQY